MLNRGITFSVIQAAKEGEEAAASAGTEQIKLQAEGTVKALEKLSHMLKGRANHMKILNVSKDDLGGFMPSIGLLQFLSNVTGAFIEPIEGEDGSVSDPFSHSRLALCQC